MKHTHLTTQPTPTQRHAGFTLAEVVLVAAVMAVLVTISFPPFIDYLQQRDIQKEEQQLAEISRAMEAFAQQNNGLPSEVAGSNDCNGDGTNGETWAECFATFTPLSAEQIESDAWDEPRTYVHFTRSEKFLGADFDIHYASVHSKGPNRDAEDEDEDGNPIAGIGVEASAGSDGFIDFLAVTQAAWWKNNTNLNEAVSQFNNLQAAGDDLMIKYTDHHTKIDRYHTTLDRMKDISDALETYAKAKYNEHAVAISTIHEDNITEKQRRAWISALSEIIFYPPSEPQDGVDNAYYAPNTGHDFNGREYEFKKVSGKVEAPLGVSPTYGYQKEVSFDSISNKDGGKEEWKSKSSNVVDRYDDMIRLMRVLGLPDSHCCNAMIRLNFDVNNDSFMDKRDELPFYYFSNPRPRTGAPCGDRPEADADSSTPDDKGYFLPPRLRIDIYKTDKDTGSRSEDDSVCG